MRGSKGSQCALYTHRKLGSEGFLKIMDRAAGIAKLLMQQCLLLCCNDGLICSDMVVWAEASV